MMPSKAALSLFIASGLRLAAFLRTRVGPPGTLFLSSLPPAFGGGCREGDSATEGQTARIFRTNALGRTRTKPGGPSPDEALAPLQAVVTRGRRAAPQAHDAPNVDRSDAHQPHALVVERAAFAEVGRARAQQHVRAAAVVEMATLGNNGHVPALERIVTQLHQHRTNG